MKNKFFLLAITFCLPIHPHEPLFDSDDKLQVTRLL
jgi:hypothetical protein